MDQNPNLLKLNNKSDWKQKTGEDLCTEMDKLMAENETNIRTQHREWFYQIAMRIGAQWLDEHLDGFRILENKKGRVRMTVNKILGAHQRKVSKILKNDPWFEIKADKTSYKSKKNARKGNKLADFVYAEQKAKKLLKTLATWFVDVGTSFIFIYWDWDKGDVLTDYQPIPEDGILPEGTTADGEGYLLDGNGERIVSAQSSQGDVVYEFISPFDIFPYGIKPDGTSRGLIYESEHSVQDMRAKYPEFAEQIKAGTTKKEHINYYQRILGIISGDAHYTSTDRKKSDTCMVQQLFEEPSRSYPDGRHIIRINEIIVHRDGLPFRHKRIPIIKFIDIENSGQYWGMGTVQNACSIQVGFNKSVSQMIENADKHANLKFKATKEAEIEEEALDDSCTEVVLYNRGETVDKIEPGSLPSYFMNMISSYYPQMFNDVTMQHEVQQGQTPSGVKSGRAIEALQEKDEAANNPTLIDFNSCLIELGEQTMELYEEFVNDEREFNVRGSGRNVKINPEDLSRLSRNVTVRSTSQLSNDMYMKKEEIKDLWQQGLFGEPNDPQVRKKVMQLYEFGNIESIFEDEDLDIEWAQEENDLMLGDDTSQFIEVPVGDGQMMRPNGMPIPPQMALTLPVAEWENQVIHIQEHNNLRKSREFRETSPEIKDRVNQHIKQHELLMQKLAPPALPQGDGGQAAPPAA